MMRNEMKIKEIQHPNSEPLGGLGLKLVIPFFLKLVNVILMEQLV